MSDSLSARPDVRTLVCGAPPAPVNRSRPHPHVPGRFSDFSAPRDCDCDRMHYPSELSGRAGRDPTAGSRRTGGARAPHRPPDRTCARGGGRPRTRPCARDDAARGIDHSRAEPERGSRAGLSPTYSIAHMPRRPACAGDQVSDPRLARSPAPPRRAHRGAFRGTCCVRRGTAAAAAGRSGCGQYTDFV